jgi:hypothetical protein
MILILGTRIASSQDQEHDQDHEHEDWKAARVG